MLVILMMFANAIPLILAASIFFYRILRPKHPFPQFFAFTGGWYALKVCILLLIPFLCKLSEPDAAKFRIVMDAVSILVSCLLLTALTKQSIGRVLLYFCFYRLIIELGIILAFLFIDALTGIAPRVQIQTVPGELRYDLLKDMLSAALLILSSEILTRKIEQLRSDIRWGPICAVACAQMFSLFVAGSVMDIYNDDLSVPLYIGMLFVDIASDVALFRSIHGFEENYALKTALQNLENKQSLQKEYYLAAAEQLRITQRMRHDFKNTLITINILLEKGEIERAKQFSEEFSSSIGSHIWVMFTGNEIIDAVLNKKAQEAANAGIEFDLQLLMPKPFPLNDYDSLSLFANILDNAIEHIRLLPPEKNHTLAVSTGIRAGFFIMRVSNACLTEQGQVRSKHISHPATTKDHPADHGHGLAIVQEIVERHDGVMQLSIEKGRFIVSIIINLSVPA